MGDIQVLRLAASGVMAIHEHVGQTRLLHFQSCERLHTITWRSIEPIEVMSESSNYDSMLSGMPSGCSLGGKA